MRAKYGSGLITWGMSRSTIRPTNRPHERTGQIRTSAHPLPVRREKMKDIEVMDSGERDPSLRHTLRARP
jgi:hypothetical protein